MGIIGKMNGQWEVFGQTAKDASPRGVWEATPEGLIVSIAILACLIAVACYVIAKIRPKSVQSEPHASQLLSNFREINSKGGLTDEEFRTIKTTLTSQLQDELNDKGKEV
jgi:hypothetical protein